MAMDRSVERRRSREGHKRGVRERQLDGSRHPFDQFIVGRTPAGRWGEPEDLQGTVVFLASPASDYVTGACINVDGGYLAR